MGGGAGAGAVAAGLDGAGEPGLQHDEDEGAPIRAGTIASNALGGRVTSSTAPQTPPTRQIAPRRISRGALAGAARGGSRWRR